MISKKLGSLIDSQKDQLAELVVAELWSKNPHFASRYGPTDQLKCTKDVSYNLSYLAQAVSSDSEPLFLDYLIWVKALFEGLKIPTSELTESLAITAELLKDKLGAEDGATTERYIVAGIAALDSAPTMPASHFKDENPLSDFARRYLSSLRTEGRGQASAMVMHAVQSGIEVKDIYLKVFEPTQHEIGRLWQTNQMTVAEEHYCTAATMLIMSQLYPKVFNNNKNGKRMVAVCVGSELHELGLHMVADIFEMEGWDTYYLGANTPVSAVLEAMKAHDPDILAISATMTFHIPAVVEMIEEIRIAFPSLRTKILVGGYPFNVEPDLWSRVGADGCASDAVGAVSAAERLLSDPSGRSQNAD